MLRSTEGLGRVEMNFRTASCWMKCCERLELDSRWRYGEVGLRKVCRRVDRSGSGRSVGVLDGELDILNIGFWYWQGGFDYSCNEVALTSQQTGSRYLCDEFGDFLVQQDVRDWPLLLC